MSSGVKYLLAGIGVVALLGGGIAAMKLTEPGNETDEESSVSETEEAVSDIYSGNSDDIVSVKVTNAAGGYTVKRTSKATDDASAVYSIEGLENVTLNDSLVSNFAPGAASLTPVAVIDENAADLSKYGLDSPCGEAEITFDGDSTAVYTLLVGNDSPAGDVYVKLKESPAVYTVSSSFVKTYSYEKEYFVSTVILEEPSDEDYPIVEKIEIERADLENPVVFEYSGENESGGTSATHVMTSPVKAYLDVSSSVDYTHGLFGLSAASVLSLSPSEAELSAAGIDNPVCTVTMTVEGGKKYVLKIGNAYSGSDESEACHTGYFEGTDVLWKFDDSDIPWVSMQPEDAMSSLVFGSYIYDLKSLEIKTSGSTDKFEFTGSEADDYTVKLNGNDFDAERYKLFYQAVIKAPAEEICMSDEGIGSLLASFTIKYNNGNPDETIEFYEAEGNRVIIKKDGVTSFKCHASFVEKSLLPNISALSGDSDFITNW